MKKNNVLKKIKTITLKYNNKTEKIEQKSRSDCLYVIFQGAPYIILLDRNINEEDMKTLEKYVGKSKLNFRKGIGYKGAIQRLYFKKMEKNFAIFNLYKKSNRKLVVSENILKVPRKELKYIYPLVLSPDITNKGLRWGKNYIIFPYKYGELQPIKEDKFKQEAPTLYNYLQAHRTELLAESSYNQRIQKKGEFYGVIRVGKYSYNNCFVAIRDNTKLIACVVRKIETDWGKKKNPIFDNHISYISYNVNNKKLTYKRAKTIANALNSKLVRQFIEGFFDARSIGSRLPIMIEKIKIAEK